jgi:hypothetical protein
MATLCEAEVLAIWEAAAERTPLSRALVLATAAGADQARVADVCIGRRDAYLVELREACFGTVYECVVDCPGCGVELELELSSADVRAGQAGGRDGVCRVDGVDITFRAVTTRDLWAVAGSADPRRQLIADCVTEVCGGAHEPASWPHSTLDALSAAMAAHDPQAAVSIDLDCAVCRHHWAAPFDIAGYVWAELAAAAGRIMLDVHGLASAYGWSEADVLAMSPARRRQYLELVAP